MSDFLRSHIMSIVLIPLGILFIGSTYVRFVVLKDYMVSYEVDCNPSEQSCFLGCEDDECIETYPYYMVEKQVNDLELQCGATILDCEAATVCLPEDEACTVTMCEPESDECYVVEETNTTNL